MALQFGRLEEVDLRKAWAHEANDFTPWLADNLDRLSDAIGIPLELQDTEVSVEQFSADILARNPRDGSNVLIENQLESTDHTHLGQILTYLAGLEAKTIIWIARRFEEAHISAIRWLNENTVAPFVFFAVKVQVVRIGDSPMVPIFDVVERPSNWERRVRASLKESGLGRTAQFCLEFWAYYAERYPDDGIRNGHKSTNVYYYADEANLRVSQYLARSIKSVGVYIATSYKNDSSESVLARIKRYEAPLREALGVEGDPRDSTIKVDIDDRENWAWVADWLHDRMLIYRKVLAEPWKNHNELLGRLTD